MVLLYWNWDFGDGGKSTAQHPSHTYAAGGTYPVSLTVTDDDGATGTTSQSVTVSSGGGGFSLSVFAYKTKGVKYADLTWSGARPQVSTYTSNGAIIITKANDGAYTDGPLGKGGHSATYKVCEAKGTSTCSNEVTVTW
jgi:PKD repeat protein